MQSKIVIATCVWKRPRAFQAFLKCYTNLNPKPHIVVQGSHGDMCKDIALGAGCSYFISDNSPLGGKWNDAIQNALATAMRINATHVMIMGSDDIMSRSMWNSISEYTGPYLALKDFYFYEVSTKRFLHWRGYRDSVHNGQPIGSGKTIRVDVLSKIKRPFTERLERALDFSCHANILRHAGQCDMFTCAQLNGMCIDIKDGENMNKFQKWFNSGYARTERIKTEARELWDIIQEY